MKITSTPVRKHVSITISNVEIFKVLSANVIDVANDMSDNDYDVLHYHAGVLNAFATQNRVAMAQAFSDGMTLMLLPEDACNAVDSVDNNDELTINITNIRGEHILTVVRDEICY